jgi:hypothetical protein
MSGAFGANFSSNWLGLGDAAFASAVTDARLDSARFQHHGQDWKHRDTIIFCFPDSETAVHFKLVWGFLGHP